MPHNISDFDPHLASAILLGYWFGIVALIGIPPNLFVIVATFHMPKQKLNPVYYIICALSVADCILLLGLAAGLPYALFHNLTVCKYGGALVYAGGTSNAVIPMFMAWNRHAIMCNTRFQVKAINQLLPVHSLANCPMPVDSFSYFSSPKGSHFCCSC